MNQDSFSDQQITDILSLRTVAVIGMSKHSSKAAHYVPKYLIDNAFIANLKNGVVILNASRGPVLQTAALIQHIKNGKVAYAALDVLENEKIDQLNLVQQSEFEQLCKESKVLLTSHIAGWTEASYYKIASVLAQKTIQFFHQ